MNDEAYRKLDYEKIITKDHYRWDWQNKKLVLLPSYDSCIGKKTEERYIYEKISLEDFRLLKDDEIVNKEHFYVWRNYCGNLIMERCGNFIVGRKADDARKKCNFTPEFNLYAKKEIQINFGKFDFLKEIEL